MNSSFVCRHCNKLNSSRSGIDLTVAHRFHPLIVNRFKILRLSEVLKDGKIQDNLPDGINYIVRDIVSEENIKALTWSITEMFRIQIAPSFAGYTQTLPNDWSMDLDKRRIG